jgi:hypothetical protein
MARTGSTSATPPPKKRGRLRQFAAVYKMTAQFDKPTPLWVFGSALLVLVVGLALTFLLSEGVFSRILGSVSSVFAALLVGLLFLTRRADKALFAQVDGRQGATAIVMQQLRKGWVTSEEPVGADPAPGTWSSAPSVAPASCCSSRDPCRGRSSWPTARRSGTPGWRPACRSTSSTSATARGRSRSGRSRAG